MRVIVFKNGFTTRSRNFLAFITTTSLDKQWPIWNKEASQFPWTYDGEETCYFLEGEVTVTPNGGEPVTMGQGDLVTFPNGMSCHWHITQPVRKHYRIE